MRLLYDVSVLGNAQRDRWQRTGVFRAVHELVRHLVAGRECEIQLCCAVNPYVLEDCLEFLAGDPILKDVPVMSNQLLIFGRMPWKTAETGRSLTAQLRGTLQRILADRIPELPASALRGADVFHSPAFHLPEELERYPSLKTFLTVHDLIPILFPDLCAKESTIYLERALSDLREDQGVFCVSKSTKSDLCERLPRLNPERVFVVPLAASENFHPVSDGATRAAVCAKYGLPDTPYFLSLSTLEPRKNFQHTIRCFCQLLAEARIKDTNLVLVGEKGWKYDAIFESLKEYELSSERVIFTGYVADSDLAALYSGALAFLFPSLYEGFGLPVLEAMQCGTPVIASDNSSLPEVIGDAGIMVNASDAVALSQAMLEVYSNPSLCEDLSARALKQAGKFNWAKSAQMTVHAYRTAISLAA